MGKLILLVAAVLLLLPLTSFGALQVIDDRETEAFSKATGRILEKAVNEFKTVQIAHYAEDNSKFDAEIDGIMKEASSELIFERQFLL